ETDRLRVLEAIAVYMHQEKSLTIKRKQALAIIERGTGLNPELVLQNLLQNGLLTGDRDLRFAPHQTIQEYFAARALKEEILRIARKRTGLLGVFVGPGLLEAANDPWWAETFIQIAGLADDPNALAVTLADLNPWLAWWCVQEGRAVNKRTTQIIQAKSMEMIQSPKVEERRRGAETLAKLQTPRALEPLITLLGDSVPEIHHLASDAVSTFGEAAVPFLVDALNDESLMAVARARALNLLAQVAYKDELKSPRVLKPLAQLAMNPQPEAAITSLQVLMSLEDEGEALLDRILTNRPPARRVKWGELVAENDCRPGVTIRADGLPDIAWYKVEAATVGGIELEYRRVEPFYIAKYPVTHAQYQAFIDDDGYTRDVWWQKFPNIPRVLRAQPFKIANYPRVNISWYEAIVFCRWLTARYRASNEISEKWVIRLPTEWEWEQAAIGYIDDEDHDRIPGFDVTRGNTPAAKIGGVCAVGLFPEGRSPFGAMDMGGNIREWCLNVYNWHTGTRRLDDDRRSLRGGSWEEADYLAAPTARDFAAGSERGRDIGFRLCIAPLNLKPVGVSPEDPGV
ncbi:MAG: SUMF1/EgtB/PvdO family nonheme iron enzyme, partial [Anaerolineae bacterium]|nr:SUMF1/EgtB/PvdO family nonheme iron enzyme [Anaerolineae bacterium]